MTACANERKDLFRDDTDHFHFLELLSAVTSKAIARFGRWLAIDASLSTERSVNADVKKASSYQSFSEVISKLDSAERDLADKAPALPLWHDFDRFSAIRANPYFGSFSTPPWARGSVQVLQVPLYFTAPLRILTAYGTGRLWKITRFYRGAYGFTAQRGGRDAKLGLAGQEGGQVALPRLRVHVEAEYDEDGEGPAGAGNWVSDCGRSDQPRLD